MLPSPHATPPQNPYYHLTAIRDFNSFFGRTDTLRRLFSAIADQQSISLVGLRRIGKSSVLRYMRLPEVQQRFERDLSKHILVLIDLGEHLQRTREDFFGFVSEQLIAQSKDRLRLDVSQRRGADEFSQLLDEIKDHGFHPVLLLDAFDSITRNPEFNPDFFSFLRAQANWGKVSYITASVASLDRFSHPDLAGSPFFNIFGLCRLGPLTKDEAHELITVPSKATGYPFTNAEIVGILTLAGQHPFFIQRVCYILFEEKYQRHTTQLRFKDIKNQVYSELLPHFAHIWKYLDAEQQEQLKEEASRKEANQRRNPELSESALFRKFVRDKYSISSFTITAAYLEEVLDKLDDLKFLGECNLSHLNIVYMQDQTDTLPRSTAEKGMAVRKLLKAAVEKLRPDGPQKDSATEWRLYNILNYRYFRSQLKNDQIWARLGISSRQFFRERNRAIETLLNVLLEMEALSQEELDM